MDITFLQNILAQLLLLDPSDQKELERLKTQVVQAFQHLFPNEPQLVRHIQSLRFNHSLGMYSKEVRAMELESINKLKLVIEHKIDVLKLQPSTTTHTTSTIKKDMITHKEKLNLLLLELYSRYQSSAEDSSLSSIILNGYTLSNNEINLLGQGLSQNQFIKGTSTKSGYFAKLTSKGVLYAENLLLQRRRYNVYVECNNGRFNVFDINSKQLEIIAAAYRLGQKEFSINHQTYGFNAIYSIAFVTNLKPHSKQELQHIANESEMTISGGILYPDDLLLYGINVTGDFIADEPFGYERKSIEPHSNLLPFVNDQRINDLKSLPVNSFDLRKLIRICEELNESYRSGSYFTVGLLLRTVINHVPPIFGSFTSFKQVIANYGSDHFKGSMRFLDDGLRSIANSYTHETIRSRESLPTPQQVSYSSQLDTLLVEIINRLGGMS